MDASDIKVGNVYRAKKPGIAGGMFVNDRQVLHVGKFGFVQYDSAAVGFGGKYKTVTMEKFLAWAGRDITGTLPPNDWLPWPPAKLPTSGDGSQ